MAERRDDDTTPDDRTPDDTAATTTREPVITSDPLGLGGTTDPDAPSRRPRPKVLSLLGEFFSMSRTTAILLVTFVVVGILYSMVREQPVVAIRTPAPPPATTTEVEPTAPTGTPTSTPPTEPVTGTTVPTTTTPTAPTGVPTGTQAPGGQPTTSPAPARPGTPTTQQAPQGTQTQPQTGQGGAAAGPTADEQTSP
uniref:hypothetical protein n=1 Tax=unclassified Dietzia TaxID=2617939 RepID=UPI000D228703|nr:MULTISPECIES: hypothetical protein [unclassified Dietzia]AVZ38910.1 hypothetical protein CT688_04865 [Dietzia sp. JS16-p6b]MBB1029225.1 hypothetical protein [Dietzia sp. DQ11-38-2]